VDDEQDPVIAHCFSGTSNRCLAALADVLITRADNRDSRERLADLFRRFPGLTIAVIAVAPHHLEVGIRDGTVLSLRFDCRPGLCCESVDALARALYVRWCTISGGDGDPRAQVGRARGAQAVVDVQRRCEVVAGGEQVSAFRGDLTHQIERLRVLER
jgi:hypothetical protein